VLRKPSPILTRLLDQISLMPVIDSHEHIRATNGDLGQPYAEPIQMLATQYMGSDLWAAGASDAEIMLLQDPAVSTDAKWQLFSSLWAATEHTAYARVTKLVLRQRYGIEELTRTSLGRIAEQLPQHDAEYSLRVVEKANIQAIVSDALMPLPRDRPIRYFANPMLKTFLDGEWHAPALWHPVFNLPSFHEIRRWEFIDYVGKLAGAHITSLAEYEASVFALIKRSQVLGVVAIKDQSAYLREIDYDLPARDDAERLFNRLLMDPRSQLAWPEVKPLDDYLFHQFIRVARDLNLPVQLHTGHMAGIRNRVDKANAAHLAPVLELHTQVEFDLFHGNWPYLGDVLFLAKNYPNVKLNLCWLPIIDPLYAQEMLKRCVMTVPHSKIHGFGGDYWDAPEYSVAHLTIAREVIATALADLVESGWLEEEQAFHLAADWLYNNPNRFYRLGLPAYQR
jgi:predicted TIM-barrel fold metal-dependent hydrolase